MSKSHPAGSAVAFCDMCSSFSLTRHLKYMYVLACDTSSLLQSKDENGHLQVAVHSLPPKRGTLEMLLVPLARDRVQTTE